MFLAKFSIPKIKKVIELSIPENWNEFSLAELHIIIEHLSRNTTRLEVALSIIHHRISLEKTIKNKNLLKYIDDVELLDCVSPISDRWFDDINLTNNPVPVIKSKYYAPKDFNDIVVGEFEKVDVYFQKFIETKDETWMRKLISYIYRPKLKGRRVSLKDYEPRKSFYSTLDYGTLQLVYLWWTSCRKNLMKLFPSIFEGGESSGSSRDKYLGFTKLIHACAGEKNGTRDNVRWNVLLKELLFECQLQQEAVDKLRENTSNG